MTTTALPTPTTSKKVKMRWYGVGGESNDLLYVPTFTFCETNVIAYCSRFHEKMSLVRVAVSPDVRIPKYKISKVSFNR